MIKITGFLSSALKYCKCENNSCCCQEVHTVGFLSLDVLEFLANRAFETTLPAFGKIISPTEPLLSSIIASI